MREHGGYFGENIDRVLDFSVNINPLGVPDTLIEVLSSELKNLVRYPEMDGKSAKTTIGSKTGLESENLILGNGATELIYLFARAINPKNVLIIQPTFTEYESAFKISKSGIHHFITKMEDDFKFNMDELIKEINDINPEVVVFCNPNNPTGAFYQPEEILRLLNMAKERDFKLFIDESFIDFTHKKSLIELVNEYPIFILRSMTKTYGIPGLRLGYGAGNKDIIKTMSELKEPWTINSLALSAVDVVLNDDAYFIKTKDFNSTERIFLYNELKGLGNLHVFESEGNFLLIKLANSTGTKLKALLMDYGIYIRTCTDFKGLNDNYIRIAVRSREDNERLIYALKKAIG